MNEEQEETTTTTQEAPGQGTAKGMGAEGERLLARSLLVGYWLVSGMIITNVPETMTALFQGGVPTYAAITLLFGLPAVVGPLVGYMVGVTHGH